MKNPIDCTTGPPGIAMRMYRGLSSGDLAAALKTFADDAVWVQPGDSPVSGEHRGHIALAGMVGPLLERGLRIDPIEVWQVEPDRVIVLSRVALAGESADEIDIVTIRNEQIVHIQHIGDTQMLARAFAAKD